VAISCLSSLSRFQANSSIDSTCGVSLKTGDADRTSRG
jgi:hypothetical protein